LDAKQLRLVEKTYESYVRNGANLEPAPKEQLAAINQQLASAFGTFSNKVLADEGKYTVAAAAQLKGIPQTSRTAPRQPRRSIICRPGNMRS
ncbi:MAG: hypothetical protein ABIT68_08270, partial [Sphingomicrobium sp.]